MNHRKSHIANRQPATPSHAFTLVELLVVIGIIALLVAILLPVASKVRIAAQRTATIGTISRISQGCEAYYSTFGAYPGTFGNAIVLPGSLSPATISFTNYPGTNPTAAGYLTSTENMVLSMLGGLNNSTGNLVYDLNTVGQGAASLNSAKPGKNQPFMEVRPNELTTTLVNPRNTGLAVGQWTPNDTPIPEILDGFANPQPILYLRAARGNSGFLSTLASPNSSAQYDVQELAAYGFPQADNTQIDSTHQLSDYYKASGSLPAGLSSYFGNSEISTGTNYVPLHKDQYILISAGPDGIFGTPDDIHN